jgi:hypothetical protein
MAGTRLTATLTNRSEVALRKEAKRLGVSLSEMLRRIVDQWADGKVK